MTDDTHPCETESPVAPLELREDSDGPSHYLTGRRVRPGDVLEFLWDEGTFLPGSYQWSRSPRHSPRLIYFNKLALGTTSMELSPVAKLRWPAKQDEWTKELVDSLGAAEHLLDSLIYEAQVGKDRISNVATPNDFRKLLCQFQLLRRKAI